MIKDRTSVLNDHSIGCWWSDLLIGLVRIFVVRMFRARLEDLCGVFPESLRLVDPVRIVDHLHRLLVPLVRVLHDVLWLLHNDLIGFSSNWKDRKSPIWLWRCEEADNAYILQLSFRKSHLREIACATKRRKRSQTKREEGRGSWKSELQRVCAVSITSNAIITK